MKIIHLDVVDAASLAHIYNKQLADIPHCYPVSPEEFEFELRSRRDKDRPWELHSEKIIVGERDGNILGFAHVAMGKWTIKMDKQREDEGLIRFLTYQPGCRPIGQAILISMQLVRQVANQLFWYTLTL